MDVWGYNEPTEGFVRRSFSEGGLSDQAPKRAFPANATITKTGVWPLKSQTLLYLNLKGGRPTVLGKQRVNFLKTK